MKMSISISFYHKDFENNSGVLRYDVSIRKYLLTCRSRVLTHIYGTLRRASSTEKSATFCQSTEQNTPENFNVQNILLLEYLS
jgi:hypothetical protein